MKKDSLTKPNKKSIIKSDGVLLSFHKIFIAVKTTIRNLFKGYSTDCYMWRMFRHILVKLNSLRRTVMKNMTTNRGRFATALLTLGLTVVVAFFLTACGGGGGGGLDFTGGNPGGGNNGGGSGVLPVTITCWNGSQAVSPNACPLSNPAPTVRITAGLPDLVLVASGAQIQSGTLTATSGNTVVSLAIRGDGTFVKNSGDYAPAVLHQFTATVNFTNAPTSTLAGTFTAPKVSCASPLVPDSAGTSCVTPVLHYTDKVYALHTGNYVYVVNKTGVAKVKNMTKYVDGFYPLANCWLSPTPQDDGKILVACQDAMSLHCHMLYINPVTDEIYEYAGAVPTNMAYVENADFTWTIPANSVWTWYATIDPATPTWGAKAHVTDGWYYTSNNNAATLLFVNNQGVVTTVNAGNFATDGSYPLLISYSK